MRDRSWISIAIGAAIVCAIGFATLASATGWNSSVVFGVGLGIGVAGFKAAKKIWNRPRKPRL